MGLNWLITGGCGFIGRNLIKRLLEERGHYIRVLDNLSVGTEDDLSEVCSFTTVGPGRLSVAASGVDLVIGDILDADLAMAVASKMDVIVHLAANTGVAPSVRNPRGDCETNVMGTLNFLEAARSNGVNRFIFASSGAPAGECMPPIHEELPPHPVSPYGASKLAGEGYCSAYNKTFGIETVALRFGNVYGPNSGRKDSVVARFIKKILIGDELEIYGDGGQTRDFIFIDDLIEAICLSVEKDVGGEVFQIATNSETTINELLDCIRFCFAKIEPSRTISASYSALRIGDVKRNFSDTSKAGRLLGWQAKTMLEDGITETLQWFLEYQNDGHFYGC